MNSPSELPIELDEVSRVTLVPFPLKNSKGKRISPKEYITKLEPYGFEEVEHKNPRTKEKFQRFLGEDEYWYLKYNPKKDTSCNSKYPLSTYSDVLEKKYKELTIEKQKIIEPYKNLSVEQCDIWFKERYRRIEEELKGNKEKLKLEDKDIPNEIKDEYKQYFKYSENDRELIDGFIVNVKSKYYDHKYGEPTEAEIYLTEETKGFGIAVYTKTYTAEELKETKNEIYCFEENKKDSLTARSIDRLITERNSTTAKIITNRDHFINTNMLQNCEPTHAFTYFTFSFKKNNKDFHYNDFIEKLKSASSHNKIGNYMIALGNPSDLVNWTGALPKSRLESIENTLKSKDFAQRIEEQDIFEIKFGQNTYCLASDEGFVVLNVYDSKNAEFKNNYEVFELLGVRHQLTWGVLHHIRETCKKILNTKVPTKELKKQINTIPLLAAATSPPTQLRQKDAYVYKNLTSSSKLKEHTESVLKIYEYTKDAIKERNQNQLQSKQAILNSIAVVFASVGIVSLLFGAPV